MDKWNLYFLGLLAVVGCVSKETTMQKYGPVGEFSLPAVTGGRELIITDKNLLGKVWVADFIFTSCQGECPMLSDNMAKLQLELPVEVGLLSFSVDPDHDTLDALKSYAKRFKAKENRWYFITGKKEDLYRTIEQGFKIGAGGDTSAPLSERFIHSTKLVLLDTHGQIRGYYDGDNVYGVTKLKNDVQHVLRQ